MSDRAASRSRKRAYHSPARQRQAEDTRQRILAAARTLFLQRGYAGTTIEIIAEEAGISAKTVAAVFGSKRGILAELLSLDTFSSRYQEILAQLRADPDPQRRVRFVAQLTRQMYETLTPEFDLLRGARTVAPELAEIGQAVEEQQWQQQKQFIAFLAECGVLRADLSQEKATDEAFVLTSFDLYHKLVIERKWSMEEYENWLEQTLTQRLFQP